MSTFKGRLSDPRLSFICIDNFQPDNYECSAFLLSHVHWDHLKGMFDRPFIQLVNDSADRFLYCSSFTHHLLTKFAKFDIDASKIVAMDVNQSYILHHDSIDTDVVINCLPAGHCPGSVMFLIEFSGRRVLYTGDFRIRVEELKKIKGRLTNEDGTVIPIHDLHLDTTFAFTSSLDDFPTRESSEKLIIEQIERWKWEIGSTLKVFISLPYRYGIEYLYLSLSKKFRKPISVHDYDSYARVEEISPHVISFESASDDDWFIHACIQKNCSLSHAPDVKAMKPCALTFLKSKNKSFKVDPKHGVPFEDGRVWKVFYSSHCSLQELQDVVTFLEPKNIYPNVNNEESEKTITDLLLKKNLTPNGEGDFSSQRQAYKRIQEEKQNRYLNTMKKFKLRI